MDEEITIINKNPRGEKIKNFLIKNKSFLFLSIAAFIIIIISVYSYEKYSENKKKKISENFNLITIEYSEKSKEKTAKKLIEIINMKDATYSPLSLYFIIDNNLLSDKNKIFSLFDIVINETSLDNEIKNLVIYKKALYYADELEENDLLKTVNPLIKSDSVWKSHALYLVAEYFYARDQKQKSKEFYNKIINTDGANYDIKQLAQTRLIRDLSE